VLLLAVLVVSQWHRLRQAWDALTRPKDGAAGAVSSDTEYWCPMCPGVVSDWPGKCPVCNMALVPRQRGEAVPLPDGVLARMQLSPYRIQLAGIRSVPLDYQPLSYEVTLAGFVEKDDREPKRLLLRAAAFEKDLPFLGEGRAAEVHCAAFPDQTFPARVGGLEVGRPLRVRVEIDNPGQGLRPGLLVTAKVKVPASQTEWVRRATVDDGQTRTAAALFAQAVGNPSGLPTALGAAPLPYAAVGQAAAARGLALAVPDGAAIDTGARRVVYVEAMPGMFDAVEVTLGPRCGDYYPLLRGLAPGQRVVTAGAFLLDAETRLNPAVAAAYFGASRSSGEPARSTSAAKQEAGKLSAADRELAAKQKVCPVTDEPLDSMGGPVRVEVNGRVVFICCKGCEAELRKDPQKYLRKLPNK